MMTGKAACTCETVGFFEMSKLRMQPESENEVNDAPDFSPTTAVVCYKNHSKPSRAQRPSMARTQRQRQLRRDSKVSLVSRLAN